MRTSLQKWGNSLAVRIPSSFAKEASLISGTVVEMTLEKGRLIVAPVKEAEYKLETLLGAVKKRNIHREVELDGPVGREAW